jgi:hypothetical protein
MSADAAMVHYKQIDFLQIYMQVCLQGSHTVLLVAVYDSVMLKEKYHSQNGYWCKELHFINVSFSWQDSEKESTVA